jgi:alkylation response protein AidB-like acyl-CoA dehydrogenase
VQFGSRELQEELLPRFTSGRMHMAFALTEPTAGSDVASLSTTARPVDDAYAINGEKIYATGSDVGDAMLVFARLPGTSRREGLLALVVATDTPGVTIERLPTMGVRATGSARVSIEDAVVSRDRLVGQVGDGWRILTAGLDLERVAAAGIACGAARYLVEHVTRYLRQRVQFGAPLFELEVVRHRLADLASEVEAAELALFRTAGRMASGTGTHVEASVAKLAATEAYMRVAHAAVQLEGGYGYTSDLVVQRHFRDAKMYEIGGGASDVQREIIGKGIGV